MIRPRLPSCSSLIQKRHYNKHIEYHKYLFNLSNQMMHGGHLSENPEFLETRISNCLKASLLHKEAADMFKSLEENRKVDIDLELASFVRHINKIESFVSPELYYKFEAICNIRDL